MQNEKYANSYRKEAKKIKNRKIWRSFATGTGIISAPLLLVLIIKSGDGGSFFGMF